MGRDLELLDLTDFTYMEDLVVTESGRALETGEELRIILQVIWRKEEGVSERTIE